MNFAIDKKEFGEAYHIGASMIFDRSVKVTLVYDKKPKEAVDKEIFLQQIDGNSKRIRYMQRKKYEIKKKNNEFTPLKETAEIINSEFKENKETAQKKIRKNFLQYLSAHDKEKVENFIKNNFKNKKSNKIFIWIRSSSYEPQRNTTVESVAQLIKICKKIDLIPILIGTYISGIEKYIYPRQPNLINFHKLDIFQIKNYVRQLYMIEVLRKNYNLKCSIGIMSGAMDGPALLGLPTFWIAKNKNNKIISKLEKREIKRIDKWKNIPNYSKIEVESTPHFMKFSKDELSDITNKINEIIKKSRNINKKEYFKLKIFPGHEGIYHNRDLNYIVRMINKLSNTLQLHKTDIDWLQASIELFLILNSRVYKDLLPDLIKSCSKYQDIDKTKIKQILEDTSKNSLSKKYHKNKKYYRHRAAHGSNYLRVGIYEFENDILPKPIRYKKTKKLEYMAQIDDLIQMWQKDMQQVKKDLINIIGKVITKLNKYKKLKK